MVKEYYLYDYPPPEISAENSEVVITCPGRKGSLTLRFRKGTITRAWGGKITIQIQEEKTT